MCLELSINFRFVLKFFSSNQKDLESNLHFKIFSSSRFFVYKKDELSESPNNELLHQNQPLKGKKKKATKVQQLKWKSTSFKPIFLTRMNKCQNWKVKKKGEEKIFWVFYFVGRLKIKKNEYPLETRWRKKLERKERKKRKPVHCYLIEKNPFPSVFFEYKILEAKQGQRIFKKWYNINNNIEKKFFFPYKQWRTDIFHLLSPDIKNWTQKEKFFDKVNINLH